MSTSKDTKRLGYRQLIYNIENGKFFYELPGDQYQELTNIDDLPPLGNDWQNIGSHIYYPNNVLIGGVPPNSNIILKANGDAIFSGDVTLNRVIFGDGTLQNTAFNGDYGVISINNQKGNVILTTGDLPNTAGFITLADIPSGGGGGGAVDSVNGQTGDVTLDIPTDNSELTNGAGYITLAEVPASGGIGEAPENGKLYARKDASWVEFTEGGGSDGGGGGAVESVNGKTGAVVLSTSDLANDSGYITSADTFSGDYNDLTNTPTIPTNNNELTNGAGYITSAEAPVQPDDLFSGDYNDLTNKPAIPSQYWLNNAGSIYYNAGNVGVGSSDPAEKLTVAGVNSGLYVTTAADETLGYHFYRDITTGELNIIGTQDTYSGYKFTQTIGDTEYVPLYIQPNSGRIGIGNESPEQSLHVTGIAKVNSLLLGTTNTYLYEGAENQLNVRLGASGPYLGWKEQDGAVLFQNLSGDLALAGAGAERMRIKSDSGNIGIGTAGPQSKLHVFEPSDGTVDTYSTLQLSGHVWSGVIRGGVKAGVGSEMHLGIRTNDTVDDVITIDSFKNVGIGTTTPGTKLDVSGVSAAGLGSLPNHMGYFGLSQANSAPFGGIVLGSGENGNSPFIAASRTGEGTACKLFLRTADQNRVTIGDTGNVGIGLTEPQAALHISSTDAIRIDTTNDSPFYMNATDSGPNYLSWERASTRVGYFGFPGNGNSINLANETADGAINIITNSSTTALSAVPNGNLGVGNQNPQARLHISSGELGTNLNDSNAFFRHSSGRNGNTDEFIIAEARREDATGVVANWESSDYSIRRNVDNTGGQSFITFNGPRTDLPMAVNLGVGNEAVPSLTATAGLVGINNTNPQYALDIYASSSPLRIVTPLEGGQHIINCANTNPAGSPTQFFVAHNGGNVELGNARAGGSTTIFSGGGALVVDGTGKVSASGGFDLDSLPELV